MADNAKEGLSVAGCAKLNEWLTGCRAVKEGLLDLFFIEVDEAGNGYVVNTDNVNEFIDAINKTLARAH